MRENLVEALRHNAQLLTLSSDEVESILSGVQSSQKQVAEIFAVLYEQLAPKVGGHPDSVSHWLRSRNRHLAARPLDLLINKEGFDAIMKYLGAIDSSQTS